MIYVRNVGGTSLLPTILMYQLQLSYVIVQQLQKQK
jgi:hypothetical protein